MTDDRRDDAPDGSDAASEDTRAILARRAAMIRRALVGAGLSVAVAGAGVACDDDVAKPEDVELVDTSDAQTSTGDADAQTTASDVPGDTNPEDTFPEVCLSPPPPDMTDTEPQICLGAPLDTMDIEPPPDAGQDGGGQDTGA